MAETRDELTELRVTTAILGERVEAIERAITVFLVSVTGVLLLGGLFFPFIADEGDEEGDGPLFLVSAPFQALGYRDDDGDTDAANVLVGLALLLLLAVVVSAILVLFPVLGRSAGRNVERWAVTTGVLLVLGVAGLWVLVGIGVSGDGGATIEPAMGFLTIGAIAFALLVLPESVRSWWRRA